MSESNGGLGGCLLSILVLLVFLAAFGLVDWSTVGSFARFIMSIVVAGILLLIAIGVFGNLKK